VCARARVCVPARVFACACVCQRERERDLETNLRRTRPESGCCVTTNKQTCLLTDVKNSCLQQVLDHIHNFIFSFFLRLGVHFDEMQEIFQ
jgi:hypothetical protein